MNSFSFYLFFNILILDPRGRSEHPFAVHPTSIRHHFTDRRICRATTTTNCCKRLDNSTRPWSERRRSSTRIRCRSRLLHNYSIFWPLLASSKNYNFSIHLFFFKFNFSLLHFKYSRCHRIQQTINHSRWMPPRLIPPIER